VKFVGPAEAAYSSYPVRDLWGVRNRSVIAPLPVRALDPTRDILADWLIERPADCVERVNTPL
jgi:hypothetical protein